MTAAIAAPPALELRDISGGYGHTTVLRGVNLTVPAASVKALLGPNGAGKTTLLKTISGLLQPASGSVVVSGWVPAWGLAGCTFAANPAVFDTSGTRA